MGLFDRVAGGLDGHAFAGALHLRAVGKLSDAQVQTAFSMDAADITDYGLIRAAAVAAGEGEVAYARRVESVIMLIEAGLVTKAQASALLDL